MIVMNLYSDEHKGTPVDLFIEEPFDFDLEFDKADTHTFDDGLSFKVVQLDTLIAMKEKVGRPNDMDDVKHLKRIKNNLS
jgi:predicted nucleotidyltransferase